MASQALTNALEATGFLSGGKPAKGVRLGKDALTEWRGRSLRPDAVWRSNSGLTVYFKAVPGQPSNEKVAQWRRDAWNHGFAPLLWVVSPNRIDLYNGFARPSAVDDAEATRLETFEGIDDELERLDAVAGRLAMETGVFWDKPLAKAVDRNSRVDQQLLSDLADLERDLLDAGLPRADAQALIGRSIFAQFLIDRGILDISESLASNMRLPDAAHRLFDWLSDTFNGDMFPQDTASPQDVHLRRVADFLEAVDPKTRQATLFPYQFDVIPVEVISSIYEQFAQAAGTANPPCTAVRTDVFYTPVPLVSMVLDEITEGITGKEAVLDLTCGSAVFLVEALRRLVARRAEKEQLTSRLVRSVLQNQIYGVDISEAAVRVAAFSLYLAALELEPGLPTLRLERSRARASVPPFKPLIGRNLIVGDAWEEHEALMVSGEPRKFGLIVGNPPWSDPGKSARAARRKKTGDDSVRLARGDSINFAYRALDFAGPDTRIGVVLSANQFFGKGIGKGPTAAQQLVESESLSPLTLVNLSSLRHWLFPNSKLPALVLFAGHRSASRETITTVQVPWSPSAAKTATIEISPSDVLAIPRDACRRSVHILKAAFLGKRRDLALLERLGADHPRLEDELQRIDTAMRAGVGGAGRGARDAKALQGQPFLNNNVWQAAGQANKRRLFALPPQLPEFDVEWATWPREAANFRAPLVLVKENLSMSPRPVVLMADSDLVYSDAFHGITVSRAHAEAGTILAAALQSGLAAWFLLMTSANFGSWMQRIKIRDLHLFPAPDLAASPNTEQGRRMVAMVRRLRRRKAIGEADRAALDEAVFDLYGLREQERIVVRDGVVRAQWQWQDGRAKSVEATSTDQLGEYACVFLGVMDDWLRAAGTRRMRAEVFDLPAEAPLRVVRFALEVGTTPSPLPEVVTPGGNLREVLERLGRRLRVRLGEVLYGRRELRVHGRAEIVIIKPSAYRHWMRICALEDADAVIVDSWTGLKP